MLRGLCGGTAAERLVRVLRFSARLDRGLTMISDVDDGELLGLKLWVYRSVLNCEVQCRSLVYAVAAKLVSKDDLVLIRY